MALDLEQFREQPSTQLDVEKFRESETKKTKIGLGESAMRAARGLGSGVSLGLTKYPAAALLMGTRALTGYGGPENTYQAALQEVSEQEKQMEAESPLVYGGGKLAGSMMLLPGTGGAVLPMMGRTAAMGGVSGFTEEEQLSDALTGAAIGAGTAGVLGGLSTLGRQAGKAWTKTTLAENFDDILKNWKKGGREQMESLLGMSAKEFEEKQRELAMKHAKQKAKDLAAGKQVFPEELSGQFVRRPAFDKSGNVTWMLQPRSKNLKEEAMMLRNRLMTEEPVENIVFRVGPRSSAGRTFDPQLPITRYPTVGEIMSDVARGTVAGTPYAGLGYLAASATGVDPTLAALGGGAFGAKQALAQAGQKALQASVMKRSLSLQPGPDKRVPFRPFLGASPMSEATSRAITAATVPTIVSPEEYTVAPEPPLRSRLQELADKFRERFSE
jgi:hypothetical protein